MKNWKNYSTIWKKLNIKLKLHTNYDLYTAIVTQIKHIVFV